MIELLILGFLYVALIGMYFTFKKNKNKNLKRAIAILSIISIIYLAVMINEIIEALKGRIFYIIFGIMVFMLLREIFLRVRRSFNKWNRKQ